MKLGDLPLIKVYDPPLECIYCGAKASDGVKLSREHIIPKALGGQLIFRNASCKPCADLIRVYEKPCVSTTFLQLRLHLDLPSYDPQFLPTTLPVVKMTESEGMDLAAIKVAPQVPVKDHPFLVYLPRFREAGLFSNLPAMEPEVTGHSIFVRNNTATPVIDGVGHGVPTSVHPEAFMLFLAKIAHGAATAHLGLGTFVPYLGEVIRLQSNAVTCYVGSGPGRHVRRRGLHRISLRLDRGFIVARIQLFCQYGVAPYDVIVGTPLRSKPYILARLEPPPWPRRIWPE